MFSSVEFTVDKNFVRYRRVFSCDKASRHMVPVFLYLFLLKGYIIPRHIPYRNLKYLNSML